MTNFHYRFPVMARYWKQSLQDWLGHFRGLGKDTLRFRCNICGREAFSPVARLTREEASCRCGASVRLRSLVHVLTLELFGQSLAIPDIPFRHDLVGVDMSGAAIYANQLKNRIGYTNTFLHKPPRLDITAPGREWLSRCDFVISSDVFEHVAPPVELAFDNVMRLLKPGGVFILTVPYANTGDTIEHYPDLHEFRIEQHNSGRVLINVTADGRVQEFDKLVFHGGEGDTLEMRVFSENGVLRQLERAGFIDVRIHRESYPQYGILWHHNWSLPISARRPLG